MSDIKRMVLAGFLITAILLFLPYYLNLVGYIDPVQQEGGETSSFSDEREGLFGLGSVDAPVFETEPAGKLLNEVSQQEKAFTINTPKYSSVVSSLSGGSLTSYIITENKPQYKGGYNFFGE